MDFETSGTGSRNKSFLLEVIIFRHFLPVMKNECMVDSCICLPPQEMMNGVWNVFHAKYSRMNDILRYQYLTKD